MKTTKSPMLPALALACGAALWAVAQDDDHGEASAGGRPMTNADVVRLTNAGVGESAILALIESSATDFETSVDRVLELAEADVGDAVIAAMVAAGSTGESSAPTSTPSRGDLKAPSDTALPAPKYVHVGHRWLDKDSGGYQLYYGWGDSPDAAYADLNKGRRTSTNRRHAVSPARGCVTAALTYLSARDSHQDQFGDYHYRIVYGAAKVRELAAQAALQNCPKTFRIGGRIVTEYRVQYCVAVDSICTSDYSLD